MKFTPRCLERRKGKGKSRLQRPTKPNTRTFIKLLNTRNRAVSFHSARWSTFKRAVVRCRCRSWLVRVNAHWKSSARRSIFLAKYYLTFCILSTYLYLTSTLFLLFCQSKITFKLNVNDNKSFGFGSKYFVILKITLKFLSFYLPLGMMSSLIPLSSLATAERARKQNSLTYASGASGPVHSSCQSSGT